MIILPIPKDGNCLFASLASFFQKPGIDHTVIRRMLVHYIYQHPDAFKTDIVSEGYTSVDQYCEHMSRERTWGDGTCLQCFTMLFKVNVWLCYSNSPDEPPSLISEHKEGAPNLALLLTNNHYDRIIAWQ